ncbi:MAG: DUF4292 domain-containing protein [Bacteroidales bacterium]|nr:DUF4292 domain-containing protein [Bacteroidales bacterium]
MNNNITDRGFEIRRGSIELEGTEIEGKFGLHARMNGKGDFYASVRGPLGIELARLLAVGNDIAAIDRFNRKVYLGKKDAVMKKNGLPVDFMQILFGDLPEELSGDYTVNSYNEMVMISGNDDFMRELTICTDEMKICREKIDANSTDHLVYLNFYDFKSSGGKKYASRITMEEKKRMFHVKLSIDDLEYGYDSDIEFSLPSYTRENL